jgi:hypothetical protein
MNVTIIEQYITSQSSTVIKPAIATATKASAIYTKPFIDLECFTEGSEVIFDLLTPADYFDTKLTTIREVKNCVENLAIDVPKASADLHIEFIMLYDPLKMPKTLVVYF